MSTKKIDYINLAFIMKELQNLKENVQNLWEAINESNDRILELENHLDKLTIED